MLGAARAADRIDQPAQFSLECELPPFRDLPMPPDARTTAWRLWLRRPQRLLLRRVAYQAHLWFGIGLGLYILFISITGSVLVYRNELMVAVTPEPYVSTSSLPGLSDEALKLRALAAYPDHTVSRMHRTADPDRAVVVWLRQGDTQRDRLFDPRTGQDVGPAVAPGVRAVSNLIALHESFLAGSVGRTVNGFAALAVMVILLTGLVIWWPGVKRWRRSLRVRRGVGWKRMIWDTHSMIGIWCVGFMGVLALSGAYLCFPDVFHGLADRIQPLTDENAGQRLVDGLLYWLAFLHFGRINGIGIPCGGPGLCDQTVKAAWAVFGLAPAAMIVTGAMLWWNREVRRWRRRG